MGWRKITKEGHGKQKPSEKEQEEENTGQRSSENNDSKMTNMEWGNEYGEGQEEMGQICKYTL